MLKGAILGDQTWDKVGEIALDRLDNQLSSGEASGRCDDPYDGHQGRGHAYTARRKDQVTTSLVSGQTQEFVLNASLVWIFHHP